MRKHGDPVLLPFAVANEDAPWFEVDVLDAQASAFQQTQPRAVKKAGHESRRAAHAREHGSDLFAREDYGEVVLSARSA